MKKNTGTFSNGKINIANEIGKFSNGKVAWHYPRLNDKFHGICRNWNMEGFLIAEKIYNKGSLRGMCKWFTNKGNLRQIEQMKDNECHGIYIEIDI